MDFKILPQTLRRMLKPMAILLAMALLALATSVGVAAGAARLMAGQGFTGLTLAFAGPDDEERLQWILPYLEEMKDIAGYASFIQTTPQEARQMVQSGQAAAAVLLPEGFLNSLVTGENASPTLVVNAARPLEMLLVGTLAQSAIRMLVSAQQGIAATMAAYQTGPPTGLQQNDAMVGINLEYGYWVLGIGQGANLPHKHRLCHGATAAAATLYIGQPCILYTAVHPGVVSGAFFAARNGLGAAAKSSRAQCCCFCGGANCWQCRCAACHANAAGGGHRCLGVVCRANGSGWFWFVAWLVAVRRFCGVLWFFMLQCGRGNARKPACLFLRCVGAVCGGRGVAPCFVAGRHCPRCALHTACAYAPGPCAAIWPTHKWHSIAFAFGVGGTVVCWLYAAWQG